MGLNFISGKWHAWDATSIKPGILLSDEDTKTLRRFDTVDDAVTWLYVNGEKLAARAMHATQGKG